MTHYPLPITHYPLPITHYPLPITHYPLPITHYPLPITHYPLPIVNTSSLLFAYLAGRHDVSYFPVCRGVFYLYPAQ
ncbi:MAG: hypothetical protein AN483_20675 [Aphanizomenon flos-aquae MDT14a]|nr:MAG: hypothetical protein AN483_20675 [Aphanizomenon flos-aquae MDT14a]